MTRFPTPGHLVSWTGLCPHTSQSGPRTRHGKTGQGSTYLRGWKTRSHIRQLEALGYTVTLTQAT